jgi:hypothetical protein
LEVPTRSINDAVWNALYRDVLCDFQEAKNLIPIDISDRAVQKSELAVTDIMQIVTWYYLVTTYGNIPYTEALDINKPFPKYDTAKTIYNDLPTRLYADTSSLSGSEVRSI